MTIFRINSGYTYDCGIGCFSHSYETEDIEADSAQAAVDMYFYKYPKRFAHKSFTLTAIQLHSVDIERNRELGKEAEKQRLIKIKTKASRRYFKGIKYCRKQYRNQQRLRQIKNRGKQC